ncbi:peptidyl-prolyl cis-trans isomerase [Breznakia pachnodae]|uniref:peptidylprolyl isomerase n=1 Tax=Breznakia pachnodae TaxID=265178 RepID=A0ABU0DXC5_9FIRM|nr:peptidyl-prolyl cis-trans isomerase [Breznakia pachnodae]MDQ0359294.1 hypothetical protein [Breznakia pachnodae]
MKKKLMAIFCGSLLVLSGCSDATTTVQNDDKVLITVGDDEITKGDMYTGLVAAGNITPVSTKMSEILVDKVVPVTDEIEESAKETLASYKESYGDDWEKTYQGYGYDTEEDFYNDVILLNARVTKLTEAYVKDNFTELAKRFKPRKAEIIEITDADKAEEALKEAKKDDADFAKIADTYGDKTTYNGSEAVYNTHSGLADVLWNNISSVEKNNTVVDKVLQDTTSGTYYIVRVTNVSPKKFKEEAIESMKDITIDTSTTDEDGNTELSLADQAFQYYLQKYDYSIHDINVYEALLSSSKKYER